MHLLQIAVLVTGGFDSIAPIAPTKFDLDIEIIDNRYSLTPSLSWQSIYAGKQPGINSLK
jgi:hypothetical protein